MILENERKLMTQEDVERKNKEARTQKNQIPNNHRKSETKQGVKKALRCDNDKSSFYRCLQRKVELFPPFFQVIINICVVGALFLSICSLKTSQKTRKDMFLPILLLERGRPIFQDSGSGEELYVQNYGQGIAREVEVIITGSKIRDTLGTIPVDDSDLPFMDKNIIMDEKKNTHLIFKYKDIFGRTIETKYDVVMKHNYWEVVGKFPKVKLPR